MFVGCAMGGRGAWLVDAPWPPKLSVPIGGPLQTIVTVTKALIVPLHEEFGFTIRTLTAWVPPLALERPPSRNNSSPVGVASMIRMMLIQMTVKCVTMDEDILCPYEEWHC